MKFRALAVAALATCFSSSAFAYDSSYCREFTKTIYVGGRAQQGYGTSCMQPDGSWMIVQQPQPVSYNNSPQWQPAPQPVAYVQQVQYVPSYPVMYAPRPCYRPEPFPFRLSISYNDWNGWNGHNGHNNWHGRGHWN